MKIGESVAFPFEGAAVVADAVVDAAVVAVAAVVCVLGVVLLVVVAVVVELLSIVVVRFSLDGTKFGTWTKG